MGAVYTIEWDEADRALSYNVYRGNLASLVLQGRVKTSTMTRLACNVSTDTDMDGRPDITDADIPPVGGEDCEDTNPAIHPGAAEQCNLVDDDCDGQIDEGCGGCPDADMDGFTRSSCGGQDCDDTSPAKHPGATEQCNTVDDDCDGQIDEGCVVCPDADGDGFTRRSCTDGFFYLVLGGNLVGEGPIGLPQGAPQRIHDLQCP